MYTDINTVATIRCSICFLKKPHARFGAFGEEQVGDGPDEGVHAVRGFGVSGEGVCAEGGHLVFEFGEVWAC